MSELGGTGPEAPQDAESPLLRVRREKLQSLRDRGIDPYPHTYDRSHTSAEAASLFEAEESEHGEGHRTGPVSVAGRIVRRSGMGRATFLGLQDGHGKIQVLLRKNNLPDSYETLSDIDIGDWVGASGPLFRTRTGEITVEADEWTVLSKSLRPLPEKWHGLADVEARYRQRYLDLISNDEAMRIAVMRTRFVSALRRFMDGRGFMEVETPVLVPVAAGGTARPFTTHHNALDSDLYLRIATELYLKRLIVGGMEKVYEIGRIFRNEGVDLTHNPEFTMMESYEAFADYTDVMRMVEEMVSGLAEEVLGTTTVEFEGETIDLSPPWPRLDLREEIRRRSGIDFLECPDIDSLSAEMKSAGFDVGRQMSWGGLLDKLVSDAVEPNLVQPSFLVDYPVEMSPLAKKKRGAPVMRANVQLTGRVDSRAAGPGRALRGLHRGHGGLQLLHGAERPHRPARPARAAGSPARTVPGRGHGPAGRGLRAGHGVRHASHRRARHRHRQARHALLRPPLHPRGRPLPPHAHPLGLGAKNPAPPGLTQEADGISQVGPPTRAEKGFGCKCSE